MSLPPHLLKLAHARRAVLLKTPYYAKILYNIVFVEVADAVCPTMGITKNLVLTYSKTFVDSLNVEELTGGVAHEIEHVLRQSHARIPDGDPTLRNIAADIPINDDLVSAGYTIIPTAVFAHTFGYPTSKTMEHYYALLRQDPPDSLSLGFMAGCGPSPRDLETESERVAQAYGHTDAVVAAVIKDTLETATKTGMARGYMTEVLQALAGPPTLSWRTLLRTQLQGAVTSSFTRTDYSFRRPHPYAFTTDATIIRPGLVGNTPSILVCLDTSGSMGTDQLQLALREAVGCLRAANAPYVYYLEADADVTLPPQRVTLTALKSRVITGRGGTDFTPAFKAAASMKPPPNILVYLTDGMGSAPPSPPVPSMRTIWVLLGDTRAPALWGSVVRL